MSTVTETDLRELKELINKGFDDLKTRMDHLDSRLTNLESNFNSLDKSMGKVETKLETLKPVLDKIPDLSEKVGELKNWKQIAIVIITGVLTTVFWFVREGNL
jgi:predicted nuclease with TOPRIM domain